MTGLHESQHLRIAHESIIRYKSYKKGYYDQHHDMKNKEKWINERFELWRSFYPEKSDEEIRNFINVFEF